MVFLGSGFFFKFFREDNFLVIVFEDILRMVVGFLMVLVKGVDFEVKIIFIVIIFFIMVVIGGFMFGYEVGVFGMNKIYNFLIVFIF